MKGRFLAWREIEGYNLFMMICIRFPNDASERRALGYLLGRFSCKSWATGEMIVPEYALPCLTWEGIPFIVQGPDTYPQLIPSIRNPPPATDSLMHSDTF